MARREVIELLDDIDGGPAEGTMTFGVDGVSYEIDLSTDHQDELRQILQRWIGAGRKTGRTRTAQASGRTRTGEPTAAQIREWATTSGHGLSTRGRIPQEIRAAYDAAH